MSAPKIILIACIAVLLLTGLYVSRELLVSYLPPQLFYGFGILLLFILIFTWKKIS
jgi:hypothetical protein